MLKITPTLLYEFQAKENHSSDFYKILYKFMTTKLSFSIKTVRMFSY